jgi:hypothetical protein
VIAALGLMFKNPLSLRPSNSFKSWRAIRRTSVFDIHLFIEGGTERDVGRQQFRNALHLAASNVVFLVEAHKFLK